MGKYFYIGTVAVIVIIIAMLLYPTVHTNISSIVVTDFTDLEKAGMAILSYAFLFLSGYLVWKHIKP